MPSDLEVAAARWRTIADFHCETCGNRLSQCRACEGITCRACVGETCQCGGPAESDEPPDDEYEENEVPLSDYGDA